MVVGKEHSPEMLAASTNAAIDTKYRVEPRTIAGLDATRGRCWTVGSWWSDLSGLHQRGGARGLGPASQCGLEFGTTDFASTERVQVIGG